MRIFKFDDRAEIKKFYYFYGKAILVMDINLEDAFSIPLDGKTRNNAAIVAPSNTYLGDAPHALVKNELFIFGGWLDARKIAKLEGCTWTEQPTRLIIAFSYGSAALSVDYGKKALICFDYFDYNRCEDFDGDDSMEIFNSKYKHSGGGLGFYQGNPTTVGGYYRGGSNEVETLGSTGWTRLPDFPKNETRHHVLMGLSSESLLLAGGLDESGSQTVIWLLKNDIWEQIGNLQQAYYYASPIMIENSIFIVPGYPYPYAIERLDFEGDRLISQRVVGNADYNSVPVLLEVPANYCV